MRGAAQGKTSSLNQHLTLYHDIVSCSQVYFQSLYTDTEVEITGRPYWIFQLSESVKSEKSKISQTPKPNL